MHARLARLTEPLVRPLAALGLALLVGCAAVPPGDISLPSPAVKPAGSATPSSVASAVSTNGVTETRSERTIRGQHCISARCGQLTVRTLAFAGYPAITAFVDLALSTMATLDTDGAPPYRGLAEYEAYFRASAKPHDETVLEARVVRNDPALVVIELKSYIFRGGANGISAVQYINWFPTLNHVASLETLLIPGQMPRFVEALRRQHQAWLQSQRQAIGPDASAFRKRWPFKPTDNAALMPDGLRVTYDRFVIAPGSFGEPSLTIPYEALEGILRPNYLTVARTR